MSLWSLLIWKPLVAGALMGVYVYLVRDTHLLFVVFSSAAIYFAFLLGFEIWNAGGVARLKARYQ